MTPPHDQQTRYLVTGRVQGVGFRWWTAQQAQRLALRGTVRNCPDGSVEVRVAGPRKTIERFAARLSDGPRSARVRGVEEKPKGEDELPDGFEIVR